jgi:hypothetical protein
MLVHAVGQTSLQDNFIAATERRWKIVVDLPKMAVYVVGFEVNKFVFDVASRKEALDLASEFV